MAYDPGIGKLVLFGGKAGDSQAQAMNDTWTYDGKTWTRQSPTISPPARSGAAMAYDPVISKIVLFGGTNIGGQLIYDTWTYSGTTWIQQHPNATPNLFQMSVAYDPTIGKLVLFGASSSLKIETWTYNGTTWTKESPAGSIPWSPGPIVYDATLQRIVLYTGDTWTYDGTVWTKQPAAPISTFPNGMSMAYHSAIGHTVRFAGMGHDPLYRGAGGPPINDTWTYNGATWTKQSPSAAPSPRLDASMAYLPGLNSLVLFGGYVPESYGASAETWTYGLPH
jgi:hypothetical protein